MENVLVYRARFEGSGTALAAKTDQRVLRKEVDADTRSTGAVRSAGRATCRSIRCAGVESAAAQSTLIWPP